MIEVFIEASGPGQLDNLQSPGHGVHGPDQAGLRLREPRQRGADRDQGWRGVCSRLQRGCASRGHAQHPDAQTG